MKWMDEIIEEYGNLDKYIKIHFGSKVPYSIIDNFCLVHLDNPDEKTIKQRENEFSLEDHFHDDCPLCQMNKKEGGFIVFDNEDDYFTEGEDEMISESYDKHLGKESKEERLVDEQLEPEDEKSIWGRSFVDMEALEEMSPEYALKILIFGIIAHFIEFKEELRSCNLKKEEKRELTDLLNNINETLISFSELDHPFSHPEGFSVYLDLFISYLRQIKDKKIKEKSKDLSKKLIKLKELLEECRI